MHLQKGLCSTSRWAKFRHYQEATKGKGEESQDARSGTMSLLDPRKGKCLQARASNKSSPHPVTSPSGQVPSESPWRLVETYLPSLTRHHHSPVGCRIEIPRAKAALFLPFVGFRKKLRLACPKKTKTPAWNIKIFRGKLGKKEGKIPLWGIFFLGRKEKPTNEILGQLSNSVFCFSEHHATMTAEYCGHCQRCTDQGPRGHWTPACQFVAWAWGSICPEGNTFCEFIQNTLQVSMGYLWPILVIFG